MGAPVIHHSDLLNAGDGTHFGAWLFGVKLASDVFAGVVFKRNGGVTALLRTVVNQSVFADVQVSGAGAAPPIVRPAVGQIVLKPVKARPALFTETLQLFVYPRLSPAQGFKLS